MIMTRSHSPRITARHPSASTTSALMSMFRRTKCRVNGYVAPKCLALSNQEILLGHPSCLDPRPADALQSRSQMFPFQVCGRSSVQLDVQKSAQQPLICYRSSLSGSGGRKARHS